MAEEKKEEETKSSTALKIQEGVHYFLENGLLVFTRRYHLERGYCCGNGCRECPYKGDTMKDKASS